jgi:hypothetical protein
MHRYAAGPKKKRRKKKKDPMDGAWKPGSKPRAAVRNYTKHSTRYSHTNPL